MLDPLAASDLLGPSDDGAPDDRGALRFRRVRDVGEVISSTVRFLRENLRELVWGIAVIIAPALLVTNVVSALLRREFADDLAGLSLGAFDPRNPSPEMLEVFTRMASSPYYPVMLVLGVLVPLLLVAVAYAYARLYREGRAGSITPGVLWAETTHLILPVITSSALVYVLIILSAVLVVIPCLGALAWLAGLVYAIPLVPLLLVARTTEADGFASAFRRARQLLKGNWLPTFGVVVLALLLLLVFLLVVSVPSALLAGAIGFDDVLTSSGAAIVVGIVTLPFTLLSYVGYTFPALAAMFQYFSLAEQTEGRGLLARVDALGAPPSTPRADAGDDGFALRPSAPPEAALPGATPPEASSASVPPAPPADEPPAPSRPGFRGSGLDGDAG